MKIYVKIDYRAIYIYCDGSMMPDSQSSGGTGYVIKFPDELEIAYISDYYGIYLDSNIESIIGFGNPVTAKNIIDEFDDV